MKQKNTENTLLFALGRVLDQAVPIQPHILSLGYICLVEKNLELFVLFHVRLHWNEASFEQQL